MALAALGGILGTLAPGLLEGGVMSTMGRLGSGFLASQMPKLRDYAMPIIEGGIEYLKHEGLQRVHKMAYDFMNDPVKSIKGVYNAAKGFFGGGGGQSSHDNVGARAIAQANPHRFERNHQINKIMGGRVGGAVVHDPSLARKQTDYMLSVPEGQSAGQRLKDSNEIFRDQSNYEDFQAGAMSSNMAEIIS